LVVKLAPPFVVMATAGLMVSRMTVIETWVVLVAPSVAMMSMVLVVVGKAARVAEATDQVVVPEAVIRPPRSPVLDLGDAEASDAVPPRATVPAVV